MSQTINWNKNSIMLDEYRLTQSIEQYQKQINDYMEHRQYEKAIKELEEFENTPTANRLVFGTPGKTSNVPQDETVFSWDLQGRSIPENVQAGPNVVAEVAPPTVDWAEVDLRYKALDLYTKLLPFIDHQTAGVPEIYQYIKYGGPLQVQFTI